MSNDKTLAPVSDDEIKALCNAAGVKWIDADEDPDGYPGGFDMSDMESMRKLFSSIAAGRVAASTAPPVQAIPGWQWVPMPSTAEMHDAGLKALKERGHISMFRPSLIWSDMEAVYAAMLSAAPTPPSQSAEPAPPTEMADKKAKELSMVLVHLLDVINDAAAVHSGTYQPGIIDSVASLFAERIGAKEPTKDEQITALLFAAKGHAERAQDLFYELGQPVAQKADAEPVAWMWEVLPGSEISKRKGAKQGVYFESPDALGVDITNKRSTENYKWTLLYTTPQAPALTDSERLDAKSYRYLRQISCDMQFDESELYKAFSAAGYTEEPPTEAQFDSIIRGIVAAKDAS